MMISLLCRTNVLRQHLTLGSVRVNLEHYERTPIQIYRKFHLQEQIKISDIYIYLLKIDCGYSL